jgi:hypothetical protein
LLIATVLVIDVAGRGRMFLGGSIEIITRITD